MTQKEIHIAKLKKQIAKLERRLEAPGFGSAKTLADHAGAVQRLRLLEKELGNNFT
jgi:hypothetical protein